MKLWGFRYRPCWKKTCGKGEFWHWETREISRKSIYWTFRAVAFSMQGSKIEFPIPSYAISVMLPMEISPPKIKIQPAVMEKFTIKCRFKTIVEHILDFLHNQDFNGTIKLFDSPFLFTYTSLRFPMQTSSEKTKPTVTKKLDCENLENQSDFHLLDISHCRNFDAKLEEMILHT